MDITAEERSALIEELCAAILSFIEADCPVALEGLGILVPVVLRAGRVRLSGETLVSRYETTRSIRFEKCSEVTSYHRERFGRLIETRDLVRKLDPCRLCSA